MINISKKSECCGCEACVQKCPKQCIEIILDKEGFYYPVVDTEHCINCHLCEKVCPIINFESINSAVNPLKAYAVKNTDVTARKNSSSGGVFVSLANHIIENGGVVFGAMFDEDFNVKHTYAQTSKELLPMLGSKYVQSHIGNCFSQAESFLKQGKTVLFTGTPCQIAGLYQFLGKEYDNLILVDVVCHGVPGPGLWNRYLKGLGYSKKIKNILFREKEGYSWSHYGFKIVIDSGVIYNDYAGNNSYMRAFLSDNSLRPSCYSCKHKRKSGSDITLGDFWGINKILPDFVDETGISMVTVNTSKGKALFETIHDLERIEVNPEVLIHCNKSIGVSSPHPLSRRYFFRLYQKDSLNLDQIMGKVMPDPSQQTFFQRIFFLPVRAGRYIARQLQKR